MPHHKLLSWTLAVPLLCLAVAGCIAPDPDASDDRTTEGPDESARMVLDWGVIDCKAVISAFAVDSHALAPHLPPGFTPLTSEEFGLPPDPLGRDAVLGIKTLECPAGQGPYDSEGPVHYGSSYSPVHPPEELVDPASEFHFVAWDSLAQNATARSLMQGLGLPIFDGHADLSGFVELGGAFVYEVSLRLGDDQYTFTGTSMAPEEGFASGFRYTDFMQGDDGMAVWWADFTGPGLRAGTGILEMPTGSRLAEVVGDTTTQAFFLASSQVSFRDGNVTLPIG